MNINTNFKKKGFLNWKQNPEKLSKNKIQKFYICRRRKNCKEEKNMKIN